MQLILLIIQHQAFAQAMQGSDDHNKCCDNDKKQKEVAVGGNGGSGGAGGAGGEGGQGGKNIVIYIAPAPVLSGYRTGVDSLFITSSKLNESKVLLISV